MADKKTILGITVETGRSAQELEQLRDAIVKFGNEGEKSAESLIDQIEALDKTTERAAKHIATGNLAAIEKDAKAALLQINELRDGAERAFGSMEKAPEAVRAALKRAEDQFHAVSEGARKVNSTLDSQKEQLREGGVAWTGIGDQINKVAGNFGGMQVKAVAAFAALREGWQIGHQVAQAMGTDFSAMEEAAGNFKKSIGSVTNALVTDGLWAAVQQGRAHFRNLGDTLLNSGKSMEAFNIVVQSGVDRQKALSLSTDELRVVADAHTQAVLGGAAALKLYQQVIDTSDPKDYAAKLTALKGTFEALTKTHKAETEEHERHQTAIKNTISAIDAEITKLEAERTAHQLGMEKITAEISERQNLREAMKKAADADQHAQQVHDGLTDSMRQSLAEVSTYAKSLDQTREQASAYADALQKDAATYKDYLSPATVKAIEELNKLIEQYQKGDSVAQQRIQSLILEIQQTTRLSEAHNQNAIVFDAATGKWTNVKDESIKLTGSLKEGTVAIANTTTEAEKLTPVLGHTGEKVGDISSKFADLNGKAKGAFDFASDAERLSTKLGTIDGELIKILEHLKGIAFHGPAAAKALDDVGNAGGSGGSGTPPRGTPPASAPPAAPAPVNNPYIGGIQ